MTRMGLWRKGENPTGLAGAARAADATGGVGRVIVVPIPRALIAAGQAVHEGAVAVRAVNGAGPENVIADTAADPPADVGHGLGLGAAEGLVFGEVGQAIAPEVTAGSGVALVYEKDIAVFVTFRIAPNQ